VLQSAVLILSADSAAKRAELEAMEMTWDGEVRIVSEYCQSVSVLKFVLISHLLRLCW